ncbi:uncharacterized protein MONOS_16917 [Monocercomonoides exilis]|uniref:uncharacterized protein n=1 Tax=Monocercomonoides exilis TaxID=2049356 RepID=UPI00355A8B29|nr:hypothetical protein MONOS_16917 [Monocercomonoides exilis]
MMKAQEIGVQGIKNVPERMLNFMRKLGATEKEKLLKMFENYYPSNPPSSALEEFAQALGLEQKVEFWQEVAFIQSRGTTQEPPSSLPNSDNCRAAFASIPTGHPKPRQFETPKMNDLLVRAQMMAGKKQEQDDCLVAPLLDLKDLEIAVAKKAIEKDLYQGDEHFGADQKNVIAEYKRVAQKEKENDAVSLAFLPIRKVFRIALSCVPGMNGQLWVMYVFGKVMFFVFLLIVVLNASGILLEGIGKESSLKMKMFNGEFRSILRECVEKRVSGWKWIEEWKWLMSWSERRREKKKQKAEEKRTRKMNEENVKLVAEKQIERLLIERGIGTSSSSGSGSDSGNSNGNSNGSFSCGKGTESIERIAKEDFSPIFGEKDKNDYNMPL